MGRAVQVVRVITDEDATPSFELDERALEDVLNQDSVKNLPVVVVSVAGRMRQGKSYLLNYMIQYLKHGGKGAWMEGLDTPSGGFQWRDGPEGCTSGILVWSEVFVVEGPRGKRANVQIVLAKAYEIGMLTFEEARKVITGNERDQHTPSHDVETFEQSLIQCQSLAVDEFRGRVKLGANQDMQDHYLTKLMEDTETIIYALVTLNLEKRRKEEAIRKKEESEINNTLAESKIREAEKSRMDAERMVEIAKKEKEEAERKQKEAERKGEQLDDLFKIKKIETEMMLQKAMHAMKEAERKCREADRTRKEAERLREEAKQNASRQSESTMATISTVGSIVSDVVRTAVPIIQMFMGRRPGRSSRRRAPRAGGRAARGTVPS